RRQADAHHHRAGFAALPIFAADHVAMLAGLDEHDEGAAAMHLDAVGAEIHPVAVGILGDHQAFGADIAAAIGGVPARRRKGLDIDRLALAHDLQHRPVLDHHRRQRRRALAPAAAIRAHEIEAASTGVEHARGARIDDDPVVGRIALDVAEQDDGRLLFLEAELVERAELELGIGPLDDLQIADLGRELDAFAQIAECREAHRLLVAGYRHSGPPGDEPNAKALPGGANSGVVGAASRRTRKPCRTTIPYCTSPTAMCGPASPATTPPAARWCGSAGRRSGPSCGRWKALMASWCASSSPSRASTIPKTGNGRAD